MHISELAVRHVEIPEQVVQVGDDVFVKVIDIDLERRRISLSLKQANEGFDPASEDFDPALYGMAAEYDEAGNYKYPEGFDPDTNEWLEGFEAQREVWEAQYAQAHERWEAHRKQVADAAKADAEAAERRRRGCDATSLVVELVGRPRAVVVLVVHRGGRGHARVRRGARRSAREAHGQLIARADARRPVTLAVAGLRRSPAPVAARRRAAGQDGRMQRIGLTGGIAAGKSVAARRLAELGAVVIDSDVLAREAVAPGSAGLDAVVEEFGRGVLAGGRVAGPGGARARSCSPTPRARARLDGDRAPDRAPARPPSGRRRPRRADHGAVVVHDIPLLVETGQADAFHVARRRARARGAARRAAGAAARAWTAPRRRHGWRAQAERRRAARGRGRRARRRGQRRRPARAGRRAVGAGSRSSGPTSSRPRRP